MQHWLGAFSSLNMRQCKYMCASPDLLWRFSSSVVVKVVWAWTLGIFSPLWPTRLSFTVKINGCSHCKLSYLRTVTRLSLPSNYPAAESDCMIFCTQPEEARKKKSLLNIRNAGTHLVRLSTPNLPALTDVAISHKNTIMAHDPGHPLHCHFTKVPPGYRWRKFRCKRANFCRSFALPQPFLGVPSEYEIQCRDFTFLAATQWMKLKTICFNVKSHIKWF